MSVRQTERLAVVQTTLSQHRSCCNQLEVKINATYDEKHWYLQLTLCHRFRHCNCVNVSAVVGVDAESSASPVDEDRIISQWREVSADQRSQLREQIDDIVRPLGLQTRLVVLERANSIALCFICMTLLALTSLRDLWQTGKLRDIVQSLFTFLSGATRPVLVKRLTWPLTDYERCLEFFSSVEGNPIVLSLLSKKG